jgi:hypothetical protein
MQSIYAKKAYFIKLGGGGEWEQRCITENVLRLGYHSANHDECTLGHWEIVKIQYQDHCNEDAGALTRHINQVKQFYEAPSDVLWITFIADSLYWCFSEPIITLHEDGSKTRPVKDKWQHCNIHGDDLLKSKLSGKLLAVQGFRGTICSIKELSYLLHKINGTSEPHIENAQEARNGLIQAIQPIIKNLHPVDLEILTDLIFRQAGWQRYGVLGKTEKDIDLDLTSPITRERIGIQIKSKSSLSTYLTYKNKFSDMHGFARFYFITHSSDKALISEVKNNEDNAFIFWGIEELTEQSVRNGLVDWLIDRAS